MDDRIFDSEYQNSGSRQYSRHLILIVLFSVLSVFVAYQLRWPLKVELVNVDEWNLTGFHAEESEGEHKFRSTNGNGEIAFPDVGQATWVRLNIEARAWRTETNVFSATVTVNGRAVGIIDRAGWRNWSMSVSDPTVLRADRLVIGIQSTPFRLDELYPESEDTRELGISVESIQIEPQYVADANILNRFPLPATKQVIFGILLSVASYLFSCFWGARPRTAWYYSLGAMVGFALLIAFFGLAANQYILILVGVAGFIVLSRILLVLPVDYLTPILIFCFPFVYLFPYISDIAGHYLIIGNDFQWLYYDYKHYLLDSISGGHFPLWSPAEGAGFPLYASPFGQSFYPLNLFLIIFFKIAAGYSVMDHQWFTVLGISIFALGLYAWLSALKLNRRAIIFATLIMAVSFKPLEAMDFPNAVHTAAWYPWILFAVTRIVQSQSTKESIKYAVGLTLAIICMLTAGYPYFIFYSIFLFGPYFVVLLVPRLRYWLVGDWTIAWRRVLLTLFAAGISALAICAPYLYKMAGLMQQTTDRGGNDFVYSTMHVFDWQDALGSWIFPPASHALGWYYFGMVGVLLILHYLVSNRPGSADMTGSSDWSVKLFFLLWIGVITYITFGKYSYLFIWLWHNMPGFSSLREWGNLNIVLVPIIAWLLAIAFQNFEMWLGNANGRLSSFQARARALLIWSFGFCVILLVQMYAWVNRLYNEFWQERFVGSLNLLTVVRDYFNLPFAPQTMYDFAESESIIFGLVAFGLLLLLGLFGYQILNLSRFRFVISTGLIIISLADVGVVGPWFWLLSRGPVPQQRKLNVAQLNRDSFTVPRTWAWGISLGEAYNVGAAPNWYFNRYVDFLSSAKSGLDSMSQLLGIIDGRKLYFSESIGHPSVRSFLDDAERFTEFEHVIDYTGDRLQVDVSASTSGYFSFIDNWDSDWEAFVDQQPTQIELLFGTFKSVPLSAGRHQVEFVYNPKFFGFSVVQR